MILVIVGTHFKGFERLVQRADAIAAKSDEEFVMQIGATRLIPSHSKFFRATSHEKLMILIREARVVVCHGGAGCILDCLTLDKIPIVVPRRKKYGEARDDHQLELTSLLEEEGKIIAVSDLTRLEDAISKYNNNLHTSRGRGAISQPLVTSLRRYLLRLSDSIDAKQR